MAYQEGRHLDIMTQLLRHLTSSPHNADLKRDIFRRTIYPRVSLSYLLYSRSYDRNPGPPLPPPPVLKDQK